MDQPDDQFRRMSVSRLKDFLSERNVPTTGKRRNELETLARKAANVLPLSMYIKRTYTHRAFKTGILHPKKSRQKN